MTRINSDNAFNLYLKNFKKHSKPKIGKESEYPLVHLDKIRFGQAVTDTTELFKQLFKSLGGNAKYNDNGDIINFKTATPYGDAIIGTDLGYCTLEIGLPPVNSITDLYCVNQMIMNKIVDVTEALQIGILGYGIQPLSMPDHSFLANKNRANAIDKRYQSNNKLNHGAKDLYLNAISAAEHTHVDITPDIAIDYLNAMNKISPYLIGAFANSNLWNAKSDTYREPRELFWDYIVNLEKDKNRHGIPKNFNNIKHYFDTLIQFEPITTYRNVNQKQVYYEFNQTASIDEFLTTQQTTVIDTTDNTLTTLQPELVDLHLHERFIWYNNRIKSIYGTVESRIAAQQIPEHSLLPNILTYGLRLNIDGLVQYTESMPLSNQLRQSIAQNGLNCDHVKILKHIVSIAKEGLQQFNEDDQLLDPLLNKDYFSIKETEIFNRYGIKKFIDDYRYKNI
ncbi:MAG: hypothetical protein EP298_04150 [Gammaproteobacteria bacterium]|nr:MAG: hypothetical protein EP298_04150 [Gammaproteobacteria bacterium]UTW43822.1 hypothetical protein KFE69_06960 [bacterium SCSIO 12844]